MLSDDAEERRRIGANVRLAREDLRLTQYQLAEMAGMTRDSYASAELGRTDFRLSVLLRIAGILGTDLPSLVAEEGSFPAVPPPPVPSKVTAGRNIRKLRREKHWRQADLSHYMGNSRSTSLSSVETGQVNITLDYLDRAADALGVSPCDLIQAGHEARHHLREGLNGEDQRLLLQLGIHPGMGYPRTGTQGIRYAFYLPSRCPHA